MKSWILAAVIGLSAAISTPAFGQSQFYDTVNVNGVNRQFLIYLPVNFEPAENMPVMFHFHGGDGSPEEALQYEINYRPLADANRFIAVYPAALLDGDGCTCWNNEGKYSNGIDELGFMSAMIDAMVANYNADPNRIYASGFSLGGSLMWDFTCFLGDKVAAVGVIAANMWQWTYSDCADALPIGVCHILGTNDFYAPYNGNQYSISVSLQNAHWVNINGANPTPTQENIGGNVTRYLWAPGEGCHGHEHYRRQGGGHDIPSFAGQRIWDFVSQYTLDGLTDCIGDCPADLDGDGSINVNDVLALIKAWGDSGGDIDGNGTTDVNDMLLLLAEYGEEC
ncbi:MAG: hypothetical protein MK116_12980 [Phycisphaerales bacterium]|nr:hypothetical protein [Phycisphaerales bacterium]